MRRYLQIVGLFILLGTGLLRPVAIAQDNNPRPINWGGEFSKMVWNQDGTLFAVSQRSRVNIHDADLNLIATFEADIPFSSLLTWTKDNQLLFMESKPYQLSQWDGKEVHSLLTETSFVRLSSDEQWLAGIVQGQLLAWDRSTGTKLTTIMTHVRLIHEILWHPVEPWLLVWSYARDDVNNDDPEIIIWDVENNEILGTIPQIKTVLGTGIQQVIWHPTAPQLAVVTDQIHIWDIPAQDFVAVSSFEHLKRLVTIQWHADGQRLGVTMPDSQRIWFWDIPTDEITIWDGHKSPIIYWRWVDDNQQLLTISKDDMALFRDSMTGIELDRMTVPKGKVNSYTMRPQTSELWVFDAQYHLSVFDMITRELVAIYFDYMLPRQLTWSDDGSAIVDETVGMAWSVTTGSVYAIEQSAEQDDTRVWSPDKHLLARVAEDGKQVSIWQGDSLQATIDVCETESCVVRNVVWNQQSAKLAVVEIYENGRSRFNIYDASSGKALFPQSVNAYSYSPVQWTPNDQYIYVQFTRDSARYYDTATGEDLGTWRNFSYSPDGTRAARIDFQVDNTQVMVMDAESLESLVIFNTYMNPQEDPILVWNPQSTHLAYMEGGSRAILIFDAETLNVVETLPEFTDHTSIKGALAWSPDGTQLAYIDYSYPVRGTIFIWEPDYR